MIGRLLRWMRCEAGLVEGGNVVDCPRWGRVRVLRPDGTLVIRLCRFHYWQTTDTRATRRMLAAGYRVRGYDPRWRPT